MSNLSDRKDDAPDTKDLPGSNSSLTPPPSQHALEDEHEAAKEEALSKMSNVSIQDNDQSREQELKAGKAEGVSSEDADHKVVEDSGTTGSDSHPEANAGDTVIQEAQEHHGALSMTSPPPSTESESSPTTTTRSLPTTTATTKLATGSSIADVIDPLPAPIRTDLESLKMTRASSATGTGEPISSSSLSATVAAAGLEPPNSGTGTPVTSLPAVVAATKTSEIDPVASYSAWRKKKDNECQQGMQPMMASFLKQHSAYDVLPVSYRQIVLDTALLVKKALSVLMQYNVVSAPLWDSGTRKFAGMLTATDFINLIQFYYTHSSYTAAVREIDQFQISQLRDVEKIIGVPPPELFSLHPLQSLYDACKLLVESRSHRLPLVDVDSGTSEEMIVSVLTQYRILKFIAMNYQEEMTLRQPLSELKIGIFTDLAVADLSTPVMDVIDMFVRRRISAVPIVDENNVVLNVFETVDVLTLVRAGVYRDLDLCVAEALLRRPEDFAGVHTCTLNDSLSSIFSTIRNSQVHRLIVVDGENKLQGIVSLSDIMRYLVGHEDDRKNNNNANNNSPSSTTNGKSKQDGDDGNNDNKISLESRSDSSVLNPPQV